MIKNYFKIAFRNLRKNLGFTTINIIGLAIGLASCLMIMLYVSDELSFDKFHPKADRIYRIHTDIKFAGKEMELAFSSDPIGETLKKDYPQVEQYVRLAPNGNTLVKKGNESFNEPNVLFADSTFFGVFSYKLLSGNPTTVLAEPNALAISKKLAEKYFGSVQNAMNQTLILENTMHCKVAGVYENMPENAHFQTDILISMKTQVYQWGNFLSHNHYTYIVLKKGTGPSVMESKFEEVTQKHLGPQMQKVMGVGMENFRKSGSYIRYALMPLTKIHLHSNRTGELASNGSIQYVYIFSAIALFILLIACINFMNLSTARSVNRAKEVGIRKVLGSLRSSLMSQFLIESIVLVAISMVIGVLLVYLALPLFNDISSKTLIISSLLNWQSLLILLAIPFVVGGIAGSYPALFLSKFQPILVLKGKLSGTNRDNIRSSLVVFQFMTSIVLIISTLVVYQQLNYIQNKQLGFTKDQVLIVHEAYALGEKTETFKNEILRQPNIISGTMSGFLPVNSSRSNTPFFPEGEIDHNKAVSIQNWSVDYDYLKTMGMEIVQGRNFSKDYGTDSTGIIINETAVKKFGFANPLGKSVSSFQLNLKDFDTYTIIGVIKDFHFESLRNEISALSMKLGRSRGAVSFKINGQNIPQTVKQIEAKWQEMANGQPFKYGFMDEEFDQMYRSETRIGTLALIFAFLSILIACLGLFGLAAFMAEQRTKEIGIRKVLGASVPNIVQMLSKDFLKLVFISTVIAFPIAWWAMHKWLQDFAYRIDIEWWVFALAGVMALLIALLTVSFQAVKAAVANPVKSLRTE
jgi:putative ABC transport system permease protein